MRNTIKKEDKLMLDLVSSGLQGNKERLELAALSLSRTIKKVNPILSKEIVKLISNYSITGGVGLRGSKASPLPIDSDSKLEIASIISNDPHSIKPPVFDNSINDQINQFISEQKNINRLLENGLKPSSSMLLIGPPGTGKTMLAKYLSNQIGKPLLILDLSSSLSSYMGKTGSNLKKVLQYARNNPSVLLFDEFDAIAKKRDDVTDLGEIKRVVNVLLMELENWPVSSVFLATSNHPELLDKAIWRRFDQIIELPLPDSEQRLQILNNELKNFLPANKNVENILKSISEFLEDKSGSDICKYADSVKRRIVLNKENMVTALIANLSIRAKDKQKKAAFIRQIKKVFGSNITVRQIASITGMSVSGVQYQLSKGNE